MRRAVDPALADLLPDGPSCTVAEAAALLSMPRSEVYDAVHGGDLRSHRVGKRGIRIYLRSIDEYRRSRAIVPVKRTRDSAPATKENKAKPAKTGSGHREALAYLQQLGVVSQPSGRR
ncbi:helix-turn-helix domain-containing protein [Azospirillum doebereinerae]|uniref:DNA-binding protein n=1 Tax=Azospirillum doebereinerae TaxID=92933 RepID=A0A3S0X8A5_9PROT|nr:helix-turn-helix domain-containing protein [Azospirillum doebereinerae]RUQ66008.1 DNA-binding protein [Azospirillum doebereinerae]